MFPMLTYSEAPPPPQLAPFVRCFWTLRGTHDGLPERILPDGSFELVFHRGEPFQMDGEVQPRAMLVGEIRRPTIVHPSGQGDVAGVRFRVGGAAAFFDFPMHEARDRMIPLLDLTRDLPESPEPSAIALFLTARLRHRRHQALVNDAIGVIGRHYAITVPDLSAHLGVTGRTLERAFAGVAGIGPKQVARIVRFQAALRSQEGLAYYDQSHRIHEFRALAGVTPTDLERERNSLNKAFVGNLQSER
jgi:AraC-like DNA-binding protein